MILKNEKKLECIKRVFHSVKVKLFITLCATVLSIIIFLIILNTFALEKFYLYSKENTLKDVTLKNFSIDESPIDGQPCLYYKCLNQFAKSLLPNQLENSSENLKPIDSELSFDTISNETSDFSNRVLYNNCANPITLSYIIENVKTDYTISDTSIPITYNGSLLKRCAVPISNIASKISFEIYITNYNDEKFKSKVFISIPFKNDTNSVYDGNITLKQNTNFVFYQYE